MPSDGESCRSGDHTHRSGKSGQGLEAGKCSAVVENFLRVMGVAGESWKIS